MDLLGTPFADLEDKLDAIGVGRRHAGRVFGQVHGRRGPLEETKDLGRHLAAVTEMASFAVVEICENHMASDGTERLVFRLHDGTRVEGVLLIQGAHDRITLCLSSQVGCAMACTFCATGTLGLTRQLTAGEMVGQVYAAEAHAGRRIARLVFMGMGEPLQNYDAVRDALIVLFDHHGRPLARDGVTISTIGLLDKMRRFGEDFGGRVQLALSLHAGTDATRRRIMPIAKTVSMEELRQALLAHPLPNGLHLMIEYVVLPGINDSEEELEALATWMEGINGLVNLIPFNPFAGTAFRSPTEDEVEAVRVSLKRRGVLAKVRWPKGRDAHGACGQLMLEGVRLGASDA